jgi:hypothetical protein
MMDEFIGCCCLSQWEKKDMITLLSEFTASIHADKGNIDMYECIL